jgi:hypothetical protein
MSGKLVEPKIISDFNGNLVAMLPIGFYFDDARWEQIWACYDRKGEALTMDDLRGLFPDEPTLKVAELKQTGGMNARDLYGKTPDK